MAKEDAQQPDVEQSDQPLTLESILDAVKRIEQTDAKGRLSFNFWGET